MGRNQTKGEGTSTDTHRKSETEGPSILAACVPMLLGCAAAVVLSNGLLALSGLVLGALWTLAQ